MSIQYRVYKNDGLGGPIVYSTPVVTTSSLSWATPPLGTPSDNSFLVRAYDTSTLLEDQNSDARTRIKIDALGNDVTGLPNGPWGLTAIPSGSGIIRVSWLYNPGNQGSFPTGFHVYIGTVAPNYAAPVADTHYARGAPGTPYSEKIAGLTGGVTYVVGVRAFNGSGEEGNRVTVSVIAVTAGPSPVLNLSGSVGP